MAKLYNDIVFSITLGLLLYFSVNSFASEEDKNMPINYEKAAKKSEPCTINFPLIEKHEKSYSIKGVVVIDKITENDAMNRARESAIANAALVSGVELTFKSLLQTNPNASHALGFLDNMIGDDPELDARRKFLYAKGATELSPELIRWANSPTHSFVMLLRSEILALNANDVHFGYVHQCDTKLAVFTIIISSNLIELSRKNMLDRIEKKRTLISASKVREKKNEDK